VTPFGSLSIRGKLVGVILLTTALSLLGGFAFVTVNDVRGFKQDMAEGTVLMARVIGDHSVSALTFGDRPEAAKILARLEALPAVEAAHLYDREGALFASFARTPGDPAPPAAAEAQHEFRGQRLHVFEPVVYQNERYGSIHVAASTLPLEHKIRRHLLILLAVLLALIFASIIFALRLQRIISEPILSLAETARWVSRTHDYSVRVEKTGADEIGALCDGFNDMLGELGKTHAELRDKSALLETLYAQEREASRNLQELNEMKTSFLVVTSHELRTPLTIIRGYTEALLGGILGSVSEAQRNSIAACQRMAYRMVETLANIQQMLEINEGLMVANPTAVDLRAAASEILEGLAPFVAQRRQRVSMDAPEAVHVTADKDKLEIVLVNLLQNAIKFTQDGGEIRVRLLSEPQAAHLIVEDTGIGIDAAELPRIFERFYPSADWLHHRSGKFQFEARGSGLGLAIAKSYVEAHGGRIWAESAGRGKGSAFHLVLPFGAKEQAVSVATVS